MVFNVGQLSFVTLRGHVVILYHVKTDVYSVWPEEPWIFILEVNRLECHHKLLDVACLSCFGFSAQDGALISSGNKGSRDSTQRIRGGGTQGFELARPFLCPILREKKNNKHFLVMMS